MCTSTPTPHARADRAAAPTRRAYGRPMTPDVELGEAGGLAYRSAGEGRPLVLLHPGTGLDGSVFFPEVLSLTERGVRVVALDLPANGRSPAGDPVGVVDRRLRAHRSCAPCGRSGSSRATWDLLGHSVRRLRRARAQQPAPRRADAARRRLHDRLRGAAARRSARPARRPGRAGGAPPSKRRGSARRARRRRRSCSTPGSTSSTTAPLRPRAPSGCASAGAASPTSPARTSRRTGASSRRSSALADVTVLAIAGERDRMPLRAPAADRGREPARHARGDRGRRPLPVRRDARPLLAGRRALAGGDAAVAGPCCAASGRWRSTSDRCAATASSGCSTRGRPCRSRGR